MGNATAKPGKDAKAFNPADIKSPPSVIQFSLYSHQKIMAQLTSNLLSVPLDVLRLVGGYLAPNIRLAFCRDLDVVIYHLESDTQETRSIPGGQWIGLLSDDVVCVRAGGPHYECSWLDARTLNVTSTSLPGEKLFDNWVLLGQGSQARWLHSEDIGDLGNRRVRFCSHGPNQINPVWYSSCLLPLELSDGRVLMVANIISDDPQMWTCRHCGRRNYQIVLSCGNCAHSRPQEVEEAQERKRDPAALWDCAVCYHQKINPQVTDCPRCQISRDRQQEAKVHLYEVSPKRDCLIQSQSWVVDDKVLKDMALFPAHLVTITRAGDIKVWTLPKGRGEASQLVRRWAHPFPDSVAALPAERLAVATLESITIYDIESGERIKTIPLGGRAMCPLPDASFLDL